MWTITSTWSLEELNKLLKEGWEPFSVIRLDTFIPDVQYWLKKQVEIFKEVAKQ